MKLRFTIYLVLSLPILSIASAQGGSASGVNSTTLNAAGNLDTIAIHGLYLDGDFDKAIAALVSAMKRKQLATHGDSVFAFKHLGVMNAARQETREKGKYYMLQLLNLEPTAKILDMYASDMIYMIFKNIQEEYEENRLRRQRAQVQSHGGAGAVAPASEAPRASVAGHPLTEAPDAKNSLQPAKEPRNHHALYWIGGASAALIGVGVAAYFYAQPAPTTRVIYDVH